MSAQTSPGRETMTIPAALSLLQTPLLHHHLWLNFVVAVLAPQGEDGCGWEHWVG